MQPLSVAKQKIEHFIRQNDLTISVLFNVLDDNHDDRLTRSEFKNKLRSLHIGLEEEEIEALFAEVDERGNGRVQLSSFIRQFQDINCVQIVTRTKRKLVNSMISPEYVFNQHAHGTFMSLPEFKTCFK
jgi:Ca2+-binding EF-hand superfamily protein